MQHPDEGLLMSLLDGELHGSERDDLENHLRACAECSAQLAELKGFMAEADGLVVALGEPPALAAGGHPVPAPLPIPRRRLSPRTLAWAASVVAALGLGFAGSLMVFRSERGILSVADHAREEASEGAAAVAPPAAPAPSEVAIQSGQRAPEANGGAANSEAPTDERAGPEADSASDRLRNEALAVRSNATESGRTGIVSQDRDLADAASVRDTTPTVAEVAAKISQMARNQEAPAARQLAAPSAGAGAVSERRRERADQPASPAFQRVSMEEAVRHLSGSIRLLDGLDPDEFEVAAADSAQPVVRVVYRVGPTEARLFLEERRVDNSFVASDLQRSTSVVVTTTEGNKLSWNDLRGFALTLSGPFSPDSLFHFKTLVK